MYRTLSHGPIYPDGDAVTSTGTPYNVKIVVGFTTLMNSTTTVFPTRRLALPAPMIDQAMEYSSTLIGAAVTIAPLNTSRITKCVGCTGSSSVSEM